MEVTKHSLSYEDVRMENIERNEKMMRALGLLPLRLELPIEGKDRQRGGRCRKVNINRYGSSAPRRSARIAAMLETGFQSKDWTVDADAKQGRSLPKRRRGREGRAQRSHRGDSTTFNVDIKAYTMSKDISMHVEDDSSSADSSGSEYAVLLNVEGSGSKVMQTSADVTQTPEDENAMSRNVACPDSLMTVLPADFGRELQDLVMRALMQATASLIGPSPGLLPHAEAGTSGCPSLNKGEGSSGTIWKEPAYNKAIARQKRKAQMNRTSAGEETDSQEEFPILENESPQQKSLRKRKLHRSRVRKANELTNNRKAVKKLPYVIHVDGTGKAKGIHKHLWHAAVRGQCGRLDPSMDNMNHHPKHVVDSIWHALEKEWEFEGFTHRAREMFERCATKFMRNRKMQLKYKCKRIAGGLKPNDVSGSHWDKIVDLSKERCKDTMSTRFIHSTAKGKEMKLEVLKERNEGSLQLEGSEDQSPKSSLNRLAMIAESVFEEEDTVDAEIAKLKNDLLRLENSKKFRHCSEEEADIGKCKRLTEIGPTKDVSAGFDGMKENRRPLNVIEHVGGNASLRSTRKGREGDLKGQASYAEINRKLASLVPPPQQMNEGKPGESLKGTEMECGDMVSFFAIIGERREEIGKAILMGLPGSKYGKKVIPKGWHLIRVYTCTTSGALEVCPFPTGWTEQVKLKTVKEAEGQNILWPDNLLHM